MSTIQEDIENNLIKGIYDVLNGHVTYSDVTYPVYKSIPKPPAATYVWIGGVIQTNDNTKDDFGYRGTVEVQVISEPVERPDKKLLNNISGVVCGLLKPTPASVFSIGSNTLTVFNKENTFSVTEQGASGVNKIKKVSIYNFLIE